MALIFEKTTVKSFYRTRYSDRNNPSSGYCEDQMLVQQLVRQRTYRLFGFIPFKTEFVLEDRPATDEELKNHPNTGIRALYAELQAGFDPFDL